MLCQHLLKFWTRSRKRRDYVTLWISWENCLIQTLLTSLECVLNGTPRNVCHLTMVCSINGSLRVFLQTSSFITLLIILTLGRTTIRPIQILKLGWSNRPCNHQIRNLKISKGSSLGGDTEELKSETLIKLDQPRVLAMLVIPERLKGVLKMFNRMIHRARLRVQPLFHLKTFIK